ncbi:flagellar biosynthetic protein FliR [Ideonella dechloratans]|uniref:Flagellar biosynthetic protein FliR n=1 Tax=Ideonella dechloratans TaxID=36863 RepID=A0A643F6T2_IDEDE|nr:flagellar biosynthetic protein FliR [Ideonella dechloratans]KAB0573857.1 flagellar biosynthetic protein FliR [Ideonella dechloratans]UFU09219.1 flagellar biosynthetic protein FliR [Ideonella dechloratans]
MISFSEAQILAWVTPVLWPFLRVLALFQILPVLGQRTVPARVRVALSFLVALCASGVAPPVDPVPLDSPLAVMLLVQQLLIGLSLGFAVRLVFAAVELAGELIGLQMGMNFAGFFDPVMASQSTAASRFFATLVSFLFIVTNGHLRVIEVVVASLQAFPVGPEPFAFLRTVQPQTWGAQIFSMGLWIALPMMAVMLFVNLVLGVIARVAPQSNIFALGFPITISVGLVGMMAMLPMLESPFMTTLGRMLSVFGG